MISMLLKYFEDFNVRQLQAYAALCLWRFCEYKNIKHAQVDELIFHLINILVANNLSDWEQRGSTMAITGRGDLLPESVVALFSQNDLVAFTSLVDSCVEVGIVDMYGGVSDQPLYFLGKCIDVLDDYGIEIPPMDVLINYKRGNDFWGEPISVAELQDVLGYLRSNRLLK